MDKTLKHLLGTVVQMRNDEEAPQDEDVIKVSDTVSVAVSVYETIRNTLEYDEEHLLRRNAIRRILKRRLSEVDSKKNSSKLLRELIWSKYLPNNKVPLKMIDTVANIFEKYHQMFLSLDENSKQDKEHYEWLLDVLSSEIETVLGPPCVDEALASYAYQALKKRVTWSTNTIKEADQDLQLYIAVHRAVLKSNRATLRYRVLTLYYPKWRNAKAGDAVVKEVVMNMKKVITSVDDQIYHPSSDGVFRFVRRHAVVFRLISDISRDNPEAMSAAIQSKDTSSIDSAITAAAKDRYKTFRTKLTRTVLRATFFLLFTKSVLAILVEYPFELFVLQTTDYLPLAINILFPPLLLALIGLTVRIPKKKNNAKIIEEVHSLFGLREDFALVYKQQRPWSRGLLKFIFNLLYVVVFLFVLSLLVYGLRSIHFNVLSIIFFTFFLSLVAYFGIRIRNTRRELVLVDGKRSLMWVLGDVMFLPMIRAGRWLAMRAPKVNIFLFFFDFIIEAPFKATIEVIESWLAFMREKREEI
jgi:hypothetical protein